MLAEHQTATGRREQNGVRPMQHRVLLCADDYGISPGVDRGIEELAGKRRLSAASALVTFPDWPGTAHRLADLRGNLAIGLHLNLTLGAPLAPMPLLAATGKLPSIGTLTAKALTRRLTARSVRAEIQAEFTRQLQRFISHVGAQPDFIDGHQHIHALPGIRDALLDALSSVEWHTRPLVRSPANSFRNITRRATATRKALLLSALSSGFRARLAAANWPTNNTFAGVSGFAAASPYAAELEAAFLQPGPLHLIMCHPGYADDVLRARDPIVARREQELVAISTAHDLPRRIWHPEPDAQRPPVDWTSPRQWMPDEH